MTDFFNLNMQFTEEEKLIQQATAAFVKNSVMPEIQQAYEKAEFRREWITQMADLGLFGMSLKPEDYGQGASNVAYGLVCQELERGDSGIRSSASVQSSLVMWPIAQYGSIEQKEQWLPLLAKGDCLGCFGLTEPDSGSDPSSMKTFAKQSSGQWVLNGSKMWITHGDIADLALVWANTEGGIRGFLVPCKTKGVVQKEMKNKLSMRASHTGELYFDDVKLPFEAMLPGTSKGISAALSCLTQARYGIAWGVVGAMIYCYEQALDYLSERHQFGEPLSKYQLIQYELVDILNEITKTQCLNYQLAKLKDNNLLDYSMVSMAKMNACREALKIARKVRNLLGANGIMAEYGIMRHMNNLESVFTYEGTDNIHHLIVGQAITGYQSFKQ